LSRAGLVRGSTAFLLLSFASVTLAQAPSQSDQTKANPQYVLPRVDVFVPRMTDEDRIQTKTLPAPQIKQPSVEAELVLVPPAPNVIKKNVNSIAIPAGLDSKATPDQKYAPRPIVSSNISIGSSFGYRTDPFTRRAKFHSGVDLKAHWGDAVGASQAGTVEFAGWYHGYGNMIIINHGGGVATHYAHLSSFNVEQGMHVERGTIIGRAGSTGRATSPHLHYEVRIDGNPMDPFQPLALDPTSDYFKSPRPTVDAGRGEGASTSGSMRER